MSLKTHPEVPELRSTTPDLFPIYPLKGTVHFIVHVSISFSIIGENCCSFHFSFRSPFHLILLVWLAKNPPETLDLKKHAKSFLIIGP